MRAIIVFVVVLAFAAVCFAKKDTGFDGFVQKLLTAVKSKLAKKAQSSSDSELSMVPCSLVCKKSNAANCIDTCVAQQREMLRKWHSQNSRKVPSFQSGRKHAETLSELKFMPCSRVCESKPEAERKSCIKTCEKKQAEVTRRWLNQNKLIVKKNNAKKVEQALSDLRMVPCSTFCANSKNTKECVAECKKRQAETTKWWNDMINKKKQQKTEKKTASLSDLSFMPCSRVCKDRTDKEACDKTCKQQQAAAIKRWNERNNRLREKFSKKTAAPVAKSLSDADLSLIPCNHVCAKKDNKESCLADCKAKNVKAAKWWSEMNKKLRERKAAPSADADLSLVPCSRICGANGTEDCMNKCHEGQRKALARWAEMNKKIRSQFKKQPNALADAELKFVPCERVCANDEQSKDKCIKTCKAKQRETTKKWLEMNKPKKPVKKEKTLTFGDAELRFMPCSKVCDNKKQADATVDIPKCLKKCAEDQRKITQNWLNGPYCRKNCAANKVADCIAQGKKVCPAKTA